MRDDPDNEEAKRAVNDFATELAGRYVPNAGVTRSGDNKDPRRVEVIVDNMMNLELLFASAELTGNKNLADIAVHHATTTMNNHIREDGMCSTST